MFMAAHYGIGQAIIFLPCGFFSSFFPRLIPAVADCMCTILQLWCGPSANLECMSEMCCTRSLETQDAKIAKNSPSGHHRTNLSGMSSQLRHLSTIGKSLLNNNISPTCPHNMVNFGSTND